MVPEDENLQSEKEDPEQKKPLFSFMQETIKQKPVNTKRIVLQFIIAAGCGILFGLSACLGFFVLRPWAESFFKEETQQVVLSNDEDQQDPETSVKQDTEQPAEDPAGPEDSEQPPENGSDQTDSEGSGTFVLTPEHYRQLMDILHGISQEANKCIAFIKPINEEDLIAEEQRQAGTTGLLVADNGTELLILCDSSVCDNATGWTATFMNDHEYRISLKKQDKTRRLAVFALGKSSIEDETWSTIKIAVLGNSYRTVQGDFVIALGNIMGYGSLSSKEHIRKFPDAKCSVLTTDIAVMPGANGFLFGQNGEVLGIIRDDALDGSSGNVVNALSISELKPILTLLLNGKAVPYAGLFGATVTEDISTRQGMPMGLYVTEIMENSPAMTAGIQNGDILQKVGETDVSSIDSFEKAILACEAEQTVSICGKRRGADGYVDIEFSVTIGSMQ